MRLLLILAIALVSVGHAEESGDQGVQFYQEFIRPILQQNCLMCHSKQIRQGGLDLSSRAALLEGGENGAVVTPGSPSASLLYKLVTHEIEPGMPFKGKKLPAESLARIKQWIETGVSYDESVQSGKSPDPEPEKVAGAKAKTDHWAFRQGDFDWEVWIEQGDRPVPHYWEHVQWVWGQRSVEQFMSFVPRISLVGILARITCPILITHGENDRQIALDYARKTYDDCVNSSKRELKIHKISEGGSEHCSLDNMFVGRDYIADWVAEILGGHTD
jgi:hypothetical protein